MEEKVLYNLFAVRVSARCNSLIVFLSESPRFTERLSPHWKHQISSFPDLLSDLSKVRAHAQLSDTEVDGSHIRLRTWAKYTILKRLSDILAQCCYMRMKVLT